MAIDQEMLTVNGSLQGIQKGGSSRFKRYECDILVCPILHLVKTVWSRRLECLSIGEAIRSGLISCNLFALHLFQINFHLHVIRLFIVTIG